MSDGDREIGEIHVADDETQRRHDDIGHQRGHDFPKGRTDHDTDREVDDVALHREFFEF